MNGFLKKYDVAVNNEDEYIKMGVGDWLRLLNDIHCLLSVAEYYADATVQDSGSYARIKMDKFMTGLTDPLKED